MTTEIRHTRQQYLELCYLQCTLRTLGLYKGPIDGWFGKASLEAIDVLTGEYVPRPDGWLARDVFFTLQRAMSAAGLGVPMTGNMDEQTTRAFFTLVERYRQQHQCVLYGPAWSRRGEITPDDWIKMKQWLSWHSRPESHIGYLTSVIAYETNETFCRAVNGKEDRLLLRDYLPLYFQLMHSSRQVEDCHTFDHYALVSINGYPTQDDRRMQPNGMVIINPVGAADGCWWDGLHPVNRAIATMQ